MLKLGTFILKVPNLSIYGVCNMDIKEMREMTGQTQKQFAEMFGIPVGTLRRWEYKESAPAPYVLKMIAERLPMKKEYMQKIETAKGSYYYDRTTKTIVDRKGTSIRINEELDGVKEQNLVLYANSLFEAYYEAIAKFDRDCKFDKQEDILWG